MSRILSAFERLPRWLQPAITGAVILFVVVLVYTVLALPRILLFNSVDLRQWLVVLVSAMGAGAVGGFAYSFVGKPLLRVPVVGRYLAGIVCTAASLTPLLLFSDRLFGGDKLLTFSKASDVVIWACCVLLFGIVMGLRWFESA